MDIDNGISVGEIIKINSINVTGNREALKVTEVGALSVADELKKLNQLRKDSLLTEDEYETQKKKLLEK